MPTPASRFTVEDTPTGLLVTITSERHGCVVAFLGAWLLGWAAGEASALRALFTAPPSLVSAFLVVWLVGWTAGGIAAGMFLALMLDGSQLIAIDGRALASRIQAFGIGRTTSYELASVRRLRIVEVAGDESTSFVLRFDHGSRSVDLVKGLHKPELERLAAEMVRRYPSLRPGRPSA